MLRIASDRLAAAAPYLLAAIVTAALAAWPAAAYAAVQDAPSVVSSRIDLSSDAAAVQLELRDGPTVDLELSDGRVEIDGRDAGVGYEPGGALDLAWRDLLDSPTGSTAALAARLRTWDAPDGAAGDALETAIEDVLGSATEADADVAANAARAEADSESGMTSQDPAPTGGDSVDRLNERVRELRAELEAVRGDDFDGGAILDLRDEIRAEVERELRRELRRDAADRSGGGIFSPLRYIWRGIGGILSLLAVYGVLVGLGIGLVFFGQKWLEGVADTARYYTVRSWLVGIAGSFLLLPAFILGTLALVISIVGIPLLIAWVPLFPVAAAVALLFGYLAVGHAAGEAMAERRFYGGEWFKRANSYYYVLTGIGLLLALFFAGYVVEMAGPWFGFVRGLLAFLAGVVTWAAFTIGFGAVLLSRFGTRPLKKSDATGSSEGAFEEEAHV